MKLLFFSPGHSKNTRGIELMCKSHSIDLEYTHSFERCKIFDYDILISNQHYFDASFIPSPIKVIFGPQICVFPSGDIIGNIKHDISSRIVYNVLSDWNIIRLLEDYERPIKIPMVSFPFAVDVDRFTTNNTVNKDLDCLVYFKARPRDHLQQVIDIVEKRNLSYRVLSYGSYNESEYIQLLHRAKCMIVIDAHESQGFALEEAMSCNIPLLVWDIQSMHDEYIDSNYQYRKYMLPLRATSVPYWSSECGIKINRIEQFSHSLDTILSTDTFSPRKFILREISPYVCMNRILFYFGLDSI